MTPEEYIKAYTRGCSNELVGGGYHEWLTPENALAAIELAREQMKETLQMEYEKGKYDMRKELIHDDKFLKAIGDTYLEWIDAGINTNDVDPADYIRDHLFD